MTDKQQYPQTGGRWIRQPDGFLEQVETPARPARDDAKAAKGTHETKKAQKSKEKDR